MDINDTNFRLPAEPDGENQAAEGESNIITEETQEETSAEEVIFEADTAEEEVIIEDEEQLALEEAEEPVSEPVAEAPAPRVANEYIYNIYEPAPKKESKAGKIALGVVTGILAVFVVSVIAISAYISFTESDLPVSTEDDKNNNSVVTPAPPPENDHEDAEADNISALSTEDPEGISEIGNKENKLPSDYPTLEQLAAPADALSLPDIYDKVSPSVVGVSCTLSRSTVTGTGIIISKDGYIITNAHVVQDAVSVMIVDNDLNEYKAKIIGSDSQTDLAVLKIEGEDFTPCEFGRSSDIRIGELSVVIGNPLGFDLYGTMTFGIISGLNRTITIGDNTMTLIQTQASINNGNSGGPLINAYGQVIGITSAKVNTTYGEGLGFAIPIDSALPILEDLIEHGYVTGRPMIGIQGEDITAILSFHYRIPQGYYVRFVTPDSGADKAGIKAADIIIGINGTTITTVEELNQIKNNFSAGDTITLTIYRDGVSMDVDVVLSEVTKTTEQE